MSPKFPQSIQRKTLLWSLGIQHVWATSLIIAGLYGVDNETLRSMFDTVAFGIAVNLGVIVADSAYRKVVAGKWGIK